MTLKASVVVAVYEPGYRIDRLVRSLDRQTLPPDEFEVVFVDDGSADDTPARLRRIASMRPNVRIERIANSGWPSRPRNVGLDLARGRYVLFADHDDEIGPESLERLYDCAVHNGSDVVVGKEVAVGRAPLDADMFRRNIPRASVVDDDLFGLLTVHRFFRTEFLRSRGIRFHERVGLLEDHPFAVQAYLDADVVSVLSDYPVYRWIIESDGGNNSYKLPHIDGYFANIRDSLDLVDAHTQPGPARDHLLLRWLRGTLTANMGPRLLNRPAEFRQRWLEIARELLAERFEPRLDELLPPFSRLRAMLLRAGDVATLLRLAAFESGRTTHPECERYEWRDGALHVTATSTLVSDDGDLRPVRFERSDDRVRNPVPPELAAALAPYGAGAGVDVTAAIGSTTCELKVRHRASSVEWYLPSTSHPELVDRGDGLILQVHCTARVDPRTAALGAPLGTGTWDLTAWTRTLGYDSKRRLDAPRQPAAPALVAGEPLVAYRAGNGTLALDVGHTGRTVLGAAKPSPDDATVDTGPSGALLTLALPRVHVSGDTELPGHLHLDGAILEGAVDLPARLSARDGAVAELSCFVAALPGSYPLRGTFRGRSSLPVLELEVTDRGAVLLHPYRRPAAPKPPPPPPSVRRRVRRSLRRLVARARRYTSSRAA